MYANRRLASLRASDTNTLVTPSSWSCIIKTNFLYVFRPLCGVTCTWNDTRQSKSSNQAGGIRSLVPRLFLNEKAYRYEATVELGYCTVTLPRTLLLHMTYRCCITIQNCGRMCNSGFVPSRGFPRGIKSPISRQNWTPTEIRTWTRKVALGFRTN